MTRTPKILIVDDKVENLVALERVLQDLPVEIIRANSGNEALALTLKNEFALALVDVQMPDMDGFETVELMHQEENATALPVIFVSAVFSGDYYKIKGVEAGAIDFLEKPIVPQVMIGKVRLFIDLYHSRIQLQAARDTLEEKVKQRTVELEQAHEQLQEATIGMIQSEKLAALGEMSAGVAHELSQPLNVIKMVAQEILIDKKRGRFSEDELFEDNLPTLVKQTNRMATIINHMRLYSRQTVGTELQSISMNEAVEGVLTLTGHQLLIHNVKINKELTDDLPNVQLDQIRMEQVILNLVTNARHAMETFRTEGMLLEIRSYRQDADEVALDVRDNGGGVPEASRDKIFEPFFTTKEAGKGTGLGLSVAKKIVQEAGGRIDLVTVEGEGSTFTIVLPVA